MDMTAIVGLVIGLVLGLAAASVGAWMLIRSEKEKSAIAIDSRDREMQSLQSRIGEMTKAASEKEESVRHLQTQNQELQIQNTAITEQRAAIEQRKREIEELYEQTRKDKEELFEKAKQELTSKFAELSQASLQKSQSQFIELANETFSKHNAAAKVDIEKLVKPVSDNLEKLEELNDELEKGRLTAYKSLEVHLDQLMKQTDQLGNALRRPIARGAWGEQVLEGILENAGFIRGVHYRIQDTTHRDDQGNLRADVVFDLPDGRRLVVDAKTPLEAFMDGMNSPTEDERRVWFEKHARLVRTHVDQLSAKQYWKQYDRSPDFTILFLSSDGAYQAAVETDKGLFTYARDKRIYITAPSTFLALVHTISIVFKEAQLQQNAEEVQTVATELCSRIGVFMGHFGKVGESLSKAGDSFEKARASFDRRVSPQMRRIDDLGIKVPKIELKRIGLLPGGEASETTDDAAGGAEPGDADES